MLGHCHTLPSLIAERTRHGYCTGAASSGSGPACAPRWVCCANVSAIEVCEPGGVAAESVWVPGTPGTPRSPSSCRLAACVSQSHRGTAECQAGFSEQQELGHLLHIRCLAQSLHATHSLTDSGGCNKCTPGQAQSWRLQVSTLPAPPVALQLTEAKNILRLQVTASITEELLLLHLKALGISQHVLGLVCLRVKDGSGPPDALIQFRTEEDASKAKKLLHGSTCNGLNLDVQYGNRASFIFTGMHCKTSCKLALFTYQLCEYKCLQPGPMLWQLHTLAHDGQEHQLRSFFAGLIPSKAMYVRSLPAHLDAKVCQACLLVGSEQAVSMYMRRVCDDVLMGNAHVTTQ